MFEASTQMTVYKFTNTRQEHLHGEKWAVIELAVMVIYQWLSLMYLPRIS